MLKVGPNPYGLCCTLGLQGTNPTPRGLEWYVGLAESIRASSIEFHFGMVESLKPHELIELRSRLDAAKIEPVLSGPWPLSELHRGFSYATSLGCRTIRTHLSKVLCGARWELKGEWGLLFEEAKKSLATLAPMAEDLGLVIAIENHQDFGSLELLELCDSSGPAVGICLDTGNPLAVGEDPLEFVKRVSHRVVHVHLKDYRSQPTSEGFRLIRCAIGDGTIPFVEMHQILMENHSRLTATLEPGALDSRHVRLLTSEWKSAYLPEAIDIDKAQSAALRRNAWEPADDGRTPWERGEAIERVVEFELEQMMKSINNMQNLGWLPS